MANDIIICHDTPFKGHRSEIIATHSELTGKTMLAHKWFREIVLHEVKRYVIVDKGYGNEIDIHQYLQKTEWIRG